MNEIEAHATDETTIGTLLDRQRFDVTVNTVICLFSPDRSSSPVRLARSFPCGIDGVETDMIHAQISPRIVINFQRGACSRIRFHLPPDLVLT